MAGPKAEGAPSSKKYAEAVVRRLQADLREEKEKHRDIDVEKVRFASDGL